MTRILDSLDRLRGLLILMSVIIGIITLRFVALPSESRERAVATSEASFHRPGIEIYFYVASDPLLDNEHDRERLSQAGLDIRVIRTPYQMDLGRASPASEELGFLFLLIANRGPGIASSIDILDLDWVPRDTGSRPTGLLEDTNFGRLVPGESYALLVDASEGLSNLDPSFDASNAKDICIELSFMDIQSNTCRYQGPRCLTELEGQPPHLQPW